MHQHQTTNKSNAAPDGKIKSQGYAQSDMKTYADVKAFKFENSATIEVTPISLKSVDKTYRYTQVCNDEDVREGYDREYIKVVVFETRTKYHYVVMVCNEHRNGMPYEPYEAFSSRKNCNANVVARQLIHSEELDFVTEY